MHPERLTEASPTGTVELSLTQAAQANNILADCCIRNTNHNKKLNQVTLIEKLHLIFIAHFPSSKLHFTLECYSKIQCQIIAHRRTSQRVEGRGTALVL